MKRYKKNRGLSLIELLFAIAILALLAAIAYPSYRRYVERANDAKAASDITEIEQAITRYVVAHDSVPTTLAAASMGGLRDPWGHAYQYLDMATVVGTGSVRKDKNLVPLNTDYDLYSMGKDGQSKPPLTAQVSRDDIVRANNGGFVGLASDY